MKYSCDIYGLITEGIVKQINCVRTTDNITVDEDLILQSAVNEHSRVKS